MIIILYLIQRPILYKRLLFKATTIISNLYLHMDLNIETSSVSDLKPFKSAWQVHVKLLHSWNSFHTTTGSDLEMVLTDVNVRYISVWHYNISYV